MPPNNVLEFTGKSRHISMREAYAESLLAGAGTYDLLDQDSVRVMVGFLSGASVAFIALGDGEAANWCENCAKNILADWQHFRQHIADVRVQLLAKEG